MKQEIENEIGIECDELNTDDYTAFDDLPLTDHIEWNYFKDDELTLIAINTSYP